MKLAQKMAIKTQDAIRLHGDGASRRADEIIESEIIPRVEIAAGNGFWDFSFNMYEYLLGEPESILDILDDLIIKKLMVLGFTVIQSQTMFKLVISWKPSEFDV